MTAAGKRPFADDDIDIGVDFGAAEETDNDFFWQQQNEETSSATAAAVPAQEPGPTQPAPPGWQFNRHGPFFRPLFWPLFRLILN